MTGNALSEAIPSRAGTDAAESAESSFHRENSRASAVSRC